MIVKQPLFFFFYKRYYSKITLFFFITSIIISYISLNKLITDTQQFHKQKINFLKSDLIKKFFYNSNYNFFFT